MKSFGKVSRPLEVCEFPKRPDQYAIMTTGFVVLKSLVGRLARSITPIMNSSARISQEMSQKTAYFGTTIHLDMIQVTAFAAV
jgi:hypothetical protein